MSSGTLRRFGSPGVARGLFRLRENQRHIHVDLISNLVQKVGHRLHDLQVNVGNSMGHPLRTNQEAQ